MFFIAGVVIVLLIVIVLRYLPVRYETLIEGVFDRRENASNFYEGVVVFWFDNPCRECIERDQDKEVLYDQCHGCVPVRAINLDPKIALRNGDSIKIVVWKTIFGRTVAYRFLRMNFAEEFVAQELQKETEEREIYHDILDRREAMIRGIGLEEYRRVKKEEKIQYAAEYLDLSPEEVVEHGYEELPRFSMHTVKKLMRELGRKPTENEIWSEERRDIAEKRARMRLTPVEDYSSECLEYRMSRLYDGYVATGTSSDDAFAEHLAECQQCFLDATEAREAFLKSKGLDCLTADECNAIRISGRVSLYRKDHVNHCYYCSILCSQSRGEHLSSQPGKECLTRNVLYVIESAVEVPEPYRIHIQNCLRCERELEKARMAYVNTVIPPPVWPKTRFRSVRAKYKNPTIA